MDKTPRTDEIIRDFVSGDGEAASIMLLRQDIEQLETELADKDRQLAESRAEIELKDKLIEQMREALASADNLIDEYAADYEHRDNVDEIREEIKAALAAEKEGL